MSSSLAMQQIDVVIPTYNGADCILDTLKTVFAQVLPDGWSMQVYMVDDASTDETQALVRSTYPQAKIVELSPNQGRSIARNRGVAAGQGELLCFLDSDCQYQSTQVLAAYIQVLNAGADASFGPLDTDFPGFWGQYQRAVYAQRIAQAQQGNMQVMTSNNFVLRRSVFERVQGFYTGYTHYGFEDYDLLQRLLSAGCDIRFCANASANHKNNDTLGALCHKLTGQCSIQRSTVHAETPSGLCGHVLCEGRCTIAPGFTLLELAGDTTFVRANNYWRACCALAFAL